MRYTETRSIVKSGFMPQEMRLQKVIQELQTNETHALCLPSLNADMAHNVIFGAQFCLDFFRAPQHFFAELVSLSDFICKLSKQDLILLIQRISNNSKLTEEIINDTVIDTEALRSIFRSWDSAKIDDKKKLMLYFFGQEKKLSDFCILPIEQLSTLFSEYQAAALSKKVFTALVLQIFPLPLNVQSDDFFHTVLFQKNPELSAIFNNWDTQSLAQKKQLLDYLSNPAETIRPYFNPTNDAKYRCAQLAVAQEWIKKSLNIDAPGMIETLLKYHSQPTYGTAGFAVFEVFLKDFKNWLEGISVPFEFKNNRRADIFQEDEKLYYKVSGEITINFQKHDISLGMGYCKFEVTSEGFVLCELAYDNPFLCALLESNQPLKQYNLIKNAFEKYSKLHSADTELAIELKNTLTQFFDQVVHPSTDLLRFEIQDRSRQVIGELCVTSDAMIEALKAARLKLQQPVSTSPVGLFKNQSFGSPGSPGSPGSLGSPGSPVASSVGSPTRSSFATFDSRVRNLAYYTLRKEQIRDALDTPFLNQTVLFQELEMLRSKLEINDKDFYLGMNLSNSSHKITLQTGLKNPRNLVLSHSAVFKKLARAYQAVVHDQLPYKNYYDASSAANHDIYLRRALHIVHFDLLKKEFLKSPQEGVVSIEQLARLIELSREEKIHFKSFSHLKLPDPFVFSNYNRDGSISSSVEVDIKKCYSVFLMNYKGNKNFIEKLNQSSLSSNQKLVHVFISAWSGSPGNPIRVALAETFRVLFAAPQAPEIRSP